MACAVAVRALLLLLLALLCCLVSQKLALGSHLPRSNPAQPRNGHAEIHNALQTFHVTHLQAIPSNDILLKVNATSFNDTGTILEVSWSNTPFPAYEDVVALYTEDASPTTTAPIKFQWAARAPTHMHTGAGSVTFRLVNMRTGVRAAFIRNGLQAPLLVAHSPIVTNTNPHAPTGVHLALTGTPGEMLVQWTASNASQTPYVAWGVVSGQYDNHVGDGSVVTYTREELCGGYATSVGWMHPGLLQRVLLTGLPADATVYYIVGDAQLGTTSREFTMRTPPPVSPTSRVSFFAIADMGQAETDGSNEMTEMPDSRTTVRRMMDAMLGTGGDDATTSTRQTNPNNHSLVIHNGDISYALGFASEWDAFFDQIQPLASSMAYMTVLGNHETDWPGTSDRFANSSIPVMDSGGECSVPYLRRLAMPRASEATPWYTFEYGPITFVQYSTEHPFEPGTPQHAFITGALARVDRSRTPWLIVGGHRPMYIDSLYEHDPDGDQDVARALRESLEELFVRYEVDVTWHGHHHSYQRTCPVVNGTCVDKGPVHMVIGHAGAGLCFNVQQETPSVFRKVHVAHGFVRVEADGEELQMTAIGNQRGEVVDEVVLRKHKGGAVAR